MLQTVIGIFDFEKEAPQTITLDIDMAHDIRVAAASDKIEDALDYKAVVDAVSELAVKGRYELVESLAEAIADLILSDFNCCGVRLRLAKPDAIENASAVGVAIARGKVF
ncbi:MAG: dihydroneopterin aldolase [Flavobacteriales bacterium]